MNTSQRIDIYTRARRGLTPRQRRRVIHKARGKERTAALALIAAVALAGCGGQGEQAVRTTEAPITTLAPPTTSTPPMTVPVPITSAAPKPTPKRTERPRASRSAATGDDFWRRLANCESSDGRNSAGGTYIGYFQFSHSNAARYGIGPSSSYEQQKAAAQHLAAHSNPRGQWPVCWARAGG